jgi:XRE family transcriptional regulator of biofilm formation
VPKKDIPRAVSLEIARLLRNERTRQGLSMTEVANRAGLSQQMVSYVERGMRNPTVDTLLRITPVLNIDLWKLIKKATNKR